MEGRVSMIHRPAITAVAPAKAATPATGNDAAIVVQSLRKTFGSACCALRDVSLTMRAGEMVALLGASGSGKSTLLRHLSGLHRADAGSTSRIALLGRELQRGGVLARDVRALRSQVATIFQQFNLVDRLPVMTNVLAGALHRMPLWRSLLARFPRAERQRAWDALARVGIEHCAWQRASTLSGGQQQRAAISRALVQGAQVILADEPIASLDPESSRRVMELLAELNRELGVTVLVSLHQVDYAFAFCPRTVALREGVVVYDGPTHELSAQRLRELYGTQTDELFDDAPSLPFTPATPLRPALHAAV
jgi:phosphonate transport system ATP-binding protein